MANNGSHLNSRMGERLAKVYGPPKEVVLKVTRLKLELQGVRERQDEAEDRGAPAEELRSLRRQAQAIRAQLRELAPGEGF